MHEDWLRHLPQQWVGIAALLMFFATLVVNLAEKYAAVAKLLPLGTWWHERQKRRQSERSGVYDDSEALRALKDRIESIAQTCRKQSEDIRALQTKVASLSAWSVYDARWHHRVEVINAARDACILPKHYDYFEFETIWQRNPQAAENLSVFDPEDQPSS